MAITLGAMAAAREQPPGKGRSRIVKACGLHVAPPYPSRNAFFTVASNKHMVIGLTGDSTKPRDR